MLILLLVVTINLSLCIDESSYQCTYVAAPDRNQILLHRVFRAHHQV